MTTNIRRFNRTKDFFTFFSRLHVASRSNQLSLLVDRDVSKKLQPSGESRSVGGWIDGRTGLVAKKKFNNYHYQQVLPRIVS